MKIFITNNSSETQKLGEEFATRLHLDQGATLSRNVIALHGELGSGKTTFVQGMAKGLGIKRRIISPTFIIVRSYKIKGKHLLFELDGLPSQNQSVRDWDVPNGTVPYGTRLVENYPSENFSTRPSSDGLRSKNKQLNRKSFYHVDLYRIVNDKGIKGLGLEEIMGGSQNIVAIEWAEKIDDLLPRKRWDVRLEYVGENKRKITIVSS